VALIILSVSKLRKGTVVKVSKLLTNVVIVGRDGQIFGILQSRLFGILRRKMEAQWDGGMGIDEVD